MATLRECAAEVSYSYQQQSTTPLPPSPVHKAKGASSQYQTALNEGTG